MKIELDAAAKRIAAHVESKIGINDTNDEAVFVSRQISMYPVFNVAAYLKYSLGHAFSGMSESDWLKEAEIISKILQEEKK